MNETRVFVFFDKITPRLRAAVSVILITAGFLIQLSTKNIFAGMPFIIFCLLLNMIRGLSIKKPQPVDLKWQEVTPDRLDEVLAHCRRIKKFRSHNLGCFIAVVVVFLFMIGFLFELIKDIPLPFALSTAMVNAFVLFSGLVIGGRRSAWMPQALDTKAEIIRQIMDAPAVKKDPGITAVPYLETGQTQKGSFPNDTRVLLKFRDAPDTFIGVQGQISINVVKSSVYPYFYTVIIARHEFGLFEKYRLLKVALERITVEKKRTHEVDVIVIRQTTTKTSGYHTNKQMQEYILVKSIEIAKRFLA